jgi:hypothetical protein
VRHENFEATFTELWKSGRSPVQARKTFLCEHPMLTLTTSDVEYTFVSQKYTGAKKEANRMAEEKGLNPTTESTQDVIRRMSRFTVLDCGNPEGFRYEVEAYEQHPDDTDRVATVHLGAFYSRETAQLIVDALNAFQSLHVKAGV